MNRRKYLTLAGTITTANLAGCTESTNNSGTTQGDISDSRSPLTNNLDSRPSITSEGSKYSIVAVDDPSCPYCARFKDNAYQQIKSNLIDTGKLDYYWLFVPLIQQWSRIGVLTLETVYAEYGTEETLSVLNSYFDNQNNISTDNVESQTQSILQNTNGVDVDMVMTAVENNKYMNRINDTADSIRSAGVSSTPTFGVFEGQQLITEVAGAQSYQTFKSLLNE